MEKEEAKQKYDDAVASGHTGALVKYDEEVADILTVNLGSIQPAQTVKVEVTMNVVLQASSQFYNFHFPIEFYPQEQIKDQVEGKLALQVSIKSTSPIT